MLIQRKLLTTEQKKEICKKYFMLNCEGCPLNMEYDNNFCSANIYKLENAIKNYWNKEITIE